MRADAQHDEPLRLLDTIGIGLRVAEFGDIDVFGFFDLVGGAVAYEDGFATPFNEHLDFRGIC